MEKERERNRIMQDLLQADEEQIGYLIDGILAWYRKHFRDWEVFLLSLEKGSREHRQQQLERIFEFLLKGAEEDTIPEDKSGQE